MNQADGDAIRREMSALRSALLRDAQSAINDARTLTDWRHHFRAHPWLACGLAAAIGYLVVPRRRPSAGAAVASHVGGAVLPPAMAGGQALAATALGWASSYLIKVAVNYLSHQGAEWMKARRDQRHGATDQNDARELHS